MKITSNDFTNLFDTSMEWGKDWEHMAYRFDLKISYKWDRAYWFENYANLIIARTYLEQNGYEYEITSDMAGGWAILTDYQFDKEVINV